MPPKVMMDDDLIVKRYVDERKSGIEIAREIGVSKKIIYLRLRELGIQIRTLSEAKMGKKNWSRYGGHKYRGRKDCGNYWAIRLEDHEPYQEMAGKNGYILEHRYVMAKHLGRSLKSWEVVHHIDRNGKNNDISNLKLFGSQTEHCSENLLSKRVNELETENAVLRSRIIELESMIDG